MTSSKVRRGRDGFDRAGPEAPKRRENGIGATRYTLPCLSVGINSTGISSPDLTWTTVGYRFRGTLSYTQFNLKALRKLLILLERIGFFVRATCHRSSCAFRVSPQAIG